MTGAVQSDSGSLVIGGRPVTKYDPTVARSLGIAAIYQQPSLFPHLTVAENIALALETHRSLQRVDWHERRRAAMDLMKRAGANLHPDRLVSTLSMPEQQLVEIGKAIGADAKILIMDEPTASLTEREVETLFGVIRGLRERGVGIVYISHRLEEISALADRITILRDGESIATMSAREVNRTEIIRMMVGRELSAVFPKREVRIGDVVLELRDLGNRSRGLHNISLALKRGEILGISGLVGSGRTELAETLFGLSPADHGQILLRGATVSIKAPAEAIRLGIGYVPEDRRQHGVVLQMPVASNNSLANLRGISRFMWIDRTKERRISERYVDELHIKTTSIYAEAGTLSGGNQQKLALARWLAIDPAVLILDEPTQGVDVGSKSEIHSLMVDLAERGLAIIMISSDLTEVLGMSDRILVMRNGTVSGVVSRTEATQANVLSLALGPAPSIESAGVGR
jgi:rhamnose transport system ATP-binding protein